MCPKTGEFTCPEPGLYLILATCCTFDMKKCLVSIRKNGKDAANIFDQDGDQNKVRTSGHKLEHENTTNSEGERNCLCLVLLLISLYEIATKRRRLRKRNCCRRAKSGPAAWQ